MPLLTARWLMVALVLVLGLRFGYVLAERTPSDRGLATVAGADRIGKGQELYDPHLDQTLWEHPDTYGPATYLLYVPFEQAFPWERTGSELRRRDHLRCPRPHWSAPVGAEDSTGTGGELLGIALGYAWATYPYTLFEIQHGINDAVVACLVVATYLAVPSAAGRERLRRWQPPPSSRRPSWLPCWQPGAASGGRAPGSCFPSHSRRCSRWS